ncbi:MAG TPA: hypothetical protein PLQ93_03610 [Bacteroidia bacterium]|nr:hypothetical protein [Bacteroidia bacterium]
MPLLKQITVTALILLGLQACRKGTNVTWDVDISIPVVNAGLDIHHFFGDTLVSTDAQGLLHLSLNREVFAYKMDSVFQIPDTSIVNSFTVPVLQPTILQPGQSLTFFPPSELAFDFGQDGVALKNFDVHAGLLNVKFSNDLSEALDLLYIIPNATRNGQALTIQVTIPPGINSLQKTYDLSGYHMNMRGLSGDKYNTISQAYTLTVNAQANPVVVTYGKGAKAELSYTKIVPEYVDGYFGQQTIKIALDTSRFDISKSITAGNFLLDEVNMNFYLQNEVGCDFSGYLSNIFSINAVSGNTVALNSDQLSSINLNRANQAGGRVYPSTKHLYFTNSNSNVAAFLSNLPDKITYEGQVKLNPLGNVSGYNDFAYYNTGFRLFADVDIPLRYSADYFLLKSSSAFTAGNEQQLNRVNYGEFAVYAENGFPFEARFQAYLKDEKGLVLDSLFLPGGNTIAAGQLNAQNEVVQSNVSNISIPISKGTIEALKKTRNIEIRSYFKMPPNPPLIKLYERYKLNIRITAELGYKVEV